jgi:hypothetical protein
VSTSNNGGTGWGVTTNGKPLPNVDFNGAGGKWVFQDSKDLGTNTLTLTSGTLDTNGKTIAAGAFSLSNSNTRVLTLGASVITLTGAAPWTSSTLTGLTVSANTATITCSGASAVFATGGTLNLNGASVAFTGAGTAVMGGGTLANLTRTGTAAKSDILQVTNNITVTGTLTINGNSTINRVLFQSSTVGSARTITAAAVSMSNVDVMDITGAGAASWNLSAITGGSGDCGGNSGITFTTATTNYRRGAGGNWSALTGWANTPGGTASSGRIPLPQDTVVVDASATATVTADMPRLGKDLSFTGFVGTWSVSSAPNALFGSLTLVAGMTLSGSQPLTFAGRSACTLTTAGKTFGFTNTLSAPGGTLTLQDAWTITGASGLSVTGGTLALNGFTVTTTLFFSTGSVTRAVTGPGGLALTSTAATTIANISSAGLTLSGDMDIAVTTASANNRTIAGSGLSYGVLTYTVAASTGTLILTGDNTWAGWTINGGHAITVTASSVQKIGAWNVNGSAGNLVTITSDAAGTAFQLRPVATSPLPFSSDYLSLKDSTAQSASGGSGNGLWYAGTHSTDVSGNTGWLFSDPPAARPIQRTTQAPMAAVR